jgi:hypothetical protein
MFPRVLPRIARNAAEILSCYGKLREAEMEANVWACAIRRSLLHAIGDKCASAMGGQHDAVRQFHRSRPIRQSMDFEYAEQSRQPSAANIGLGALFLAAHGLFVPDRNRILSGLPVAAIRQFRCPGTATPLRSNRHLFQKSGRDVFERRHMSLIDLNFANTPSSAPALRNFGTTYGIGNPAAWFGVFGSRYPSVLNASAMDGDREF